MRPWIAAAVLLTGCPAAAAYRGNAVIYHCDNGQVVHATYLGVDRAQVSLAGRTYRLKNANLLFLPPYSPDLNPIEQLFSKLKHLTRQGEPRTVEATWRRVGHVLNLVAPTECAN